MTDEELDCPDCPPGKQVDDQGAVAHLDGCPRIDTLGQIGPPWSKGPWSNWCHNVKEKKTSRGKICMRPEGHTDKCPGDWKGMT